MAAVRAWLGGRGRRLEFWLCSLGLLAAHLATAMLIEHLAPGQQSEIWLRITTLALWTPFAFRRARDAGAHLWLCPPPLVATLIAVLFDKVIPTPGLHVVNAFLISVAAYGVADLLVIGTVILLGLRPSRAPDLTPVLAARAFG
jgi:hypothetical protein